MGWIDAWDGLMHRCMGWIDAQMHGLRLIQCIDVHIYALKTSMHSCPGWTDALMHLREQPGLRES